MDAKPFRDAVQIYFFPRDRSTTYRAGPRPPAKLREGAGETSAPHTQWRVSQTGKWEPLRRLDNSINGPSRFSSRSWRV